MTVQQQLQISRVDRNVSKRINFTYKEAKRLSATQHSCVEEILHNMTISMSPKYIGNIRLGLKETLSKELLTYSEPLLGVPLAFDNIKVVSSSIIDDQDSIKLIIQLSFFVFKPEPGKLLTAMVNKITNHHLGCVIHNCINSSVRQPNTDVLTTEENDIVSNICVDDVILFKVWKLDIHHGILFVLGDIVQECYKYIEQSSKISQNNFKKEEEQSSSSSSSSSISSISSMKCSNSSNTPDSNAPVVTRSPKKKKKSLNPSNGPEEVATPSPKKRKKKRKEIKEEPHDL